MRFARTAAVAALLAVAAPAVAHAASVVYRDASYNIWIAAPDGSFRKQVTTDATADGLHYTAPSMDDAGDIVATGSPDKFWTRVMSQAGTDVRGPFLLKAPVCSISPFTSVVDPSGKFIALTYVDAGVSPTSCLQVGTFRTKMIFGDVPTVGDPLPSFDGLLNPRWVSRPGFGLAGTKSDNAIHSQDLANPGTPMPAWISVDPAVADLDSFDVSRVADLVMVEVSPPGAPAGGEARDLIVYPFSGPGPTPPIGAAVCSLSGLVASSTSPARPRWSPDGTQISWTGADGVYVSPAPVAGAGGACVIRPTLIAPGGRDADWGKADVIRPSGPGGGPSNGTAPGAPAVLTPKAASAGGAVTLRFGLTKAAALTVRVERILGGKRKPALVGTVRAKGVAGKNTLRIAKVKGHRLAKGRYRLTILPAGGAPTVITIRVR